MNDSQPGTLGSERLAARAAALIPQDVSINQVFVCQTAPAFWLIVVNYITGLAFFWLRFRCVAVTDQAIYVLDSTRFSGGAQPRSLLATLPRQTQLGPVSGRWGEIELMNQRHWVHVRFHDAVRAADLDAGYVW